MNSILKKYGGCCGVGAVCLLAALIWHAGAFLIAGWLAFMVPVAVEMHKLWSIAFEAPSDPAERRAYRRALQHMALATGVCLFIFGAARIDLLLLAGCPILLFAVAFTFVK